MNKLYPALAGFALLCALSLPAFSQHSTGPVDTHASEAAVEAAKEKAAAAAAESTYDVTIWDHVFTQEQADAGKALYTTNCLGCHGKTGRGSPGGPPITGVALNKKWSDTTLLDIYTFARAYMPPGKAGTIGTEQDYVDIIAYIIEMHGAEPGDTRLPYDETTLGNIYIVKKPAK